MTRQARGPGADRPPGQDPYAVLGLTPQASDQDVTRSYRRLVRRLHPDTGAPADQDAGVLGEVLAAYHVLGDARRRAAYDEQRRREAARAAPAPGSSPVTRDAVPIPVRIRPRTPAGRASRGNVSLRAGPLRWLRRA